MKKQLLYLLSLAFLLSCAADEFAAKKSQSTYSVSSAMEYEAKMCAQYSLIKPEVDILIMWDNSTSSFAMNQENLNAIKTLVRGITDNRFNFRILNIPLLGNARPILIKSPDSEDRADYIIPDNTTYDMVKVSDPAAINNAINMIDFPIKDADGTVYEAGISLSINTINKYKKIFRKNANTFIMAVSNGDDQQCERLNPSGDYACAGYSFNNFMSNKTKDMLCIRGNTNQYPSHCASAGLTHRLDARMFRFLSVIPTTKSCRGFNTYRSSAYGLMSKAMYTQSYATNTYNDPTSTNDVYNLCGNNSTFINGILASLESVIDYHEYRYWPVASSSQQLDLDSIRVYRNGALLPNRTGHSNPTNGYRLVQNSNSTDLVAGTFNTRIRPTVGEPFTGKVIELIGSDQTLLGNCLSVYYTDVKATIGYIYLKAGKPSLDKMAVKMTVQGQTFTIPQSTTEGWEYIPPILVGTLATQNPEYAIVDRPSNDNILGHFIKLNGSYRVQNNQNITFQVDYVPASSNAN